MKTTLNGKTKFGLFIAFIIAAFTAPTIICLIICPDILTVTPNDFDNVQKLKDSINVLNTQLLDCNNKFDNEIIKYDTVVNSKTTDSIAILKNKLNELKTKNNDLTNELRTSDKAWQYYQGKYYQCTDKLTNEIK
jgi:hypothetical protein